MKFDLLAYGLNPQEVLDEICDLVRARSDVPNESKETLRLLGRFICMQYNVLPSKPILHIGNSQQGTYSAYLEQQGKEIEDNDYGVIDNIFPYILQNRLIPSYTTKRLSWLCANRSMVSPFAGMTKFLN